MKNIITAITVMFLFVGCVAINPIKTSNDVLSKTIIDNDPYKKITWIRTPAFRNYGGIGYYSSFLRVLIKNENPITYQFYVSDEAKSWRFYSDAYDNSGARLDFIGIDREVTSSAWTKEDFVISLSKDYLEKSTVTGINIKASGKRGDKIFFIPGYFVDGFLKKIDMYLKGRQ